MKIKRYAGITAVITMTALLLPGSLLGAGRSSAAPQANAPKGKYKDYVLDNYGSLKLLYNNTKTGTSKIALSGPNLMVHTPNYTFHADRMELLGSTGKVTQGHAQGHVRIVTRGEEGGQTTTITCDTADYAATADPKDRGVIDLKGTVRSVTRGPSFAEPFIVTGDTGQIRFIDDENTEVTLTNGSASVTPIEPKPKKPAGNGGKQP